MCGCFPVGHVVKHVDRQHDVKGAVAYRQRGDIGVEQRRVSGRPQHPHRQIAPGRLHWPPGQRAHVVTVAAAGIQYPQPRREPGRIQNPGHDVEVRMLMLPQALAGAQVPVIGILAGPAISVPQPHNARSRTPPATIWAGLAGHGYR